MKKIHSLGQKNIQNNNLKIDENEKARENKRGVRRRQRERRGEERVDKNRR